MKRVLFLIGLAAAVFWGCVEKGAKGAKDASTASLFRLHWAGAARIANGPGPTNLQNVLALPTTTELRNEVFTKLARTPQEFWKKSLPSGAADASALLRPLLDDLWNNESLVELRGSGAQ